MIVITLTDTPPKVRGDLSKWLLEVNTGVYVGNVSARVREELWNRVCSNLRNGRATMVYNAQGEQKMDFRVHNSAWDPVDYEGLKLMRHPDTGRKQGEDPLTKQGFSKAAQRRIAEKRTNGLKRKENHESYIVIDLETTGLSCETDHIIEAAALRVVNKEVTEEFCKLIKIEEPLPESIVKLTGITDQMLADYGEPLDAVLEQYIDFIRSDVIVSHNASFDLGFIQAESRRLDIAMQRDFKVIDTLQIARKKVRGLSNYKLDTLGEYFNLDVSGAHRALKDCHLTYAVLEKLNEMAET